mmetsp:Transcript_14962/g.33495  ORF Transcript_14962/g.33495 Transcript_14962/m.33495 type:complete len:245 (-) Transcript_14962:304-1038(-)
MGGDRLLAGGDLISANRSPRTSSPLSDQNCTFASMFAKTSRIASSPRNSHHSLKKGLMRMLMNPTWHVAMFVCARSMKGEIGRPASASASPCLKNSSMTLLDHSFESSQGLAGLLTSAACKHMVASSRTSFRSGVSNAPAATRVLNFERCSKWNFMSVPRMHWTMVERASAYCSFEKSVNGSIPSVSISRHARLTWKLSSTLWSLYRIACSCLELTRKALEYPGCSKSCIAAASIKQYLSRSLK